MNTPETHAATRRLATLTLVALFLAAGFTPALAQEKPLTLTEAQLNDLLKSSADTLGGYTEPDKSILDTQYFGLLRDGKPVGCEIFTTTAVRPMHTRACYLFDDRVCLQNVDRSTTRILSTGLAAPSFNGVETSLTLTVTGDHPVNLKLTASRAADLIRLRFPDNTSSKDLRVTTAGHPVALSGELQRLIRLRKWTLGDTLALWHLDAVNGNLTPVVLRAVAADPASFGLTRKFADVAVQTWAKQDAEKPDLVLTSTTFFDPLGNVVLVIRPDGITKTVLTKTEFEKDWADKFTPSAPKSDQPK